MIIVCNGWIRYGYKVDIMWKNNMDELNFPWEKNWTALHFLYNLQLYNCNNRALSNHFCWTPLFMKDWVLWP